MKDNEVQQPTEVGGELEIPDDAFVEPDRIQALHDGMIQANSVGLYRACEGQVRAVARSEALSQGVVGFGESVHEALRHFADELVRRGVWIEVTDRREWKIQKQPVRNFSV